MAGDKGGRACAGAHGALYALAGTAAALGVTATASGAAWSSAQRIPNDDQSATSTLNTANAVANVAPDGKASIVFRARGNRLWVSERGSTTGRFGKPLEAFPNLRSITPRFGVSMDSKRRLAVALGQSTGTFDALTGIAGEIESSKGFGKPERLSPSNGLTYGTPTIVANPKGDVFAAYAGQSQGAAAVYVERGSNTSARFSGRTTLKGLTGSMHVAPPKVDVGIANDGTLYVAFQLEDGSISTARRGPGGWKQFPAIAQPVDGNGADHFALDVPESGQAVLVFAQNRDIRERRLSRDSAGWTTPQTVAADAYALASDVPVDNSATPPVIPALNVLRGLDVATNTGGDIAVAWGTNPYFVNSFGFLMQGGSGAQMLYSRIMRTRSETAWPRIVTTTADPGWSLVPRNAIFEIDSVRAEMDNARHAVVVYESNGGTQGTPNPLAATVWNGSNARAWSGTQDFSRFCNTANGLMPPSLATSASRGVTVAWGCVAPAASGSNFAPGLIWTRSFR